MGSKWVVDSGHIISRYDGQRHYVSAGEVARLHRLTDREWVRRIGNERPDLFPRSDGEYRDLRGVAPPQRVPEE